MSSPSTISRFDELNLPQPLMRALEEVGYESPSAIQAMTIPHLLAGRDLLGQAQTGTGKTAAFALTLLDWILHERKRGIQALVLAPTRELATQIAAEFRISKWELPRASVRTGMIELRTCSGLGLRGPP